MFLVSIVYKFIYFILVTTYVITWWVAYGNQPPNLQQMARRILSLTSSLSSCERNWSTFEGVSVYFKTFLIF